MKPFYYKIEQIDSEEGVYEEIYEELQDLKDHADREAEPGAQRAAQRRYEGGRGVTGRLCDGLDVQRHQVNIQLQIVRLE